MIDVDNEQLLPLAAARKHPALRNQRTGKPGHVSSIFRYAMHGARAVNGERIRLETVKLPSGLVTSTEAIGRFVQRLTDPDVPVPSSTPKQREKEIAEAETELRESGMLSD